MVLGRLGLENMGMTQPLETQSKPKLYLTAAEARELALPSMADQLKRWNQLQAELRQLKGGAK